MLAGVNVSGILDGYRRDIYSCISARREIGVCHEERQKASIFINVKYLLWNILKLSSITVTYLPGIYVARKLCRGM